MKKLSKKLVAYFLLIVFSLLAFSGTVFADYTLRYNVQNPPVKCAYVGGSHNKIVNVAIGRIPGNGAWYITSYSQQPEALILRYDISEFSDVREAGIAIATLPNNVTAPAVKHVEIYEVTGDWADGYIGLPTYNETPVAKADFKYVSAAEEEVKTDNGYRSLVNDGYPSVSESLDTSSGYGTTGLKNFDHMVDITEFVQKKKSEGATEIDIMLKAVDATEINMQTVRLYTEFTDNTLPQISYDRDSFDFALGDGINMDIDVLDSDEVASVIVEYDGKVILEQSDIASAEHRINVSIPKEEATQGTHKLMVKVVDSFGGTSISEKELSVGRIKVISDNFETDSSLITFNTEIKNVTASEMEIIVVICRYDENDNILDVECEGKVVTSGETVTFAPSIQQSSNLTNKVFAYIWEGNECFAPLTASYTN